MNKLVDKLFKGIDYFTGILTGLMVFFVFLNVVLRTFFNAGLTWSEELARYLFVYVTYIGAISAMRANAHLGVDTLISRMKPQVQIVMYIVSQTIIAILMIILVWGSEKMVAQNTASEIVTMSTSDDDEIAAEAKDGAENLSDEEYARRLREEGGK